MGSPTLEQALSEDSATQAPGHTLGEEGGLQIEVSESGARWLGCTVPLADGGRRQVLLRAADAREPGYLGAIVGRYANRLAGAAFELDGQRHTLLPNEGRNQLHGGPEGYDQRPWRIVERSARHLRLHLHSPAGDQGYPGALEAEVEYRVDAVERSVLIRFEATVSAPCPVSLSSHAYFNLDGDTKPVTGHILRLAASQMLPVAPDMIPLGTLADVVGTPFDFRQAQPLGARLGQGPQQALASGYDHCVVLDEAAAAGQVPAAELTASDGRLRMRLFTTYPGLQVYSGNHLAGTRGHDGQSFAPHAGLALEPQFFPDAPNQATWRDQGCVLRPGEQLSRWMLLRFDAAASR